MGLLNELEVAAVVNGGLHGRTLVRILSKKRHPCLGGELWSCRYYLL